MKTLNLKNSVLVLICFIEFSFSMTAQKSVIQVNQLPEKAKNFINQNFNKEGISSVQKEEEFLSEVEYKVIFSNGTKIEFNKNGNWKEVANLSKTNNLKFIPAPILSYCKTSFPNTFIKEIKKSKWKFEVELSNDLEIEFDSKGNFIRIDD